MRIDKVYIESFKNLKKFEIDFDQNEMNSVLLGQNATGKSNLLEAIVIIFKYLDLGEIPPKEDYFEYEIKYICRDREIEVSFFDKEYEFHVKNDSETEKISISPSKFFSNKQYLPKYVFTYYSGNNDRLSKLFQLHKEQSYKTLYAEDIVQEDIEDLRRLFLVEKHHNFFVLLAFYVLNKHRKKQDNFLEKFFNIKDIESVLFILKDGSKPSWKGDERFWGADGLIRLFLSCLWDQSLAPIYEEPEHRADKEKLYLYVSQKKKLDNLIVEYFKKLKTHPQKISVFKILEGIHLAGLLDNIKIKVKKKTDGEIDYQEFSEGEQQLITVFGLLKFTQDKETLVLLDEPDTHLNPLWKWQYLELLNDMVKGSDPEAKDSTQIIINSHDPLLIGGLNKNQVRVFRRDRSNNIIAVEPESDPKGLGVAGILMSDLFGLPTILDRQTQKDLNRKRYLQGKVIRDDISDDDYQEYKKLKQKLEAYGFYEEVEDQWFKYYIAEMSKHEFVQEIDFSEDQKKRI